MIFYCAFSLKLYSPYPIFLVFLPFFLYLLYFPLSMSFVSSSSYPPSSSYSCLVFNIFLFSSSYISFFIFIFLAVLAFLHLLILSFIHSTSLSSSPPRFSYSSPSVSYTNSSPFFCTLSLSPSNQSISFTRWKGV